MVLRKIILHIKWRLDKIGFFNSWKDETYLKFVYRLRVGKKLDLEHPLTFNEKLQWLKLNDRRPEYTQMVDKYDVKKYVANIIGEEYIIPTLGVWDRADEIDFDSLPKQFVLKCTHDSGSVFVCKDKDNFDKKDVIKKINKSLNRNYYWIGREWPYKNIKPRVIAEALLGEKSLVDEFSSEQKNSPSELNDYKLTCFNGKVKGCLLCSGRNTDNGLHMTYYDREWKRFPFEWHYPAEKTEFKKPDNFEKMIELAEKLSKGIAYLSVDFYEYQGKIYFGELTFFSGGGAVKFSPSSWDYELGNWIILPKEK